MARTGRKWEYIADGSLVARIFDEHPDISVAIQVMSEKKIRHLPVIENDKIVGMVSYRDLVSYLLPEVVYMAEDIY